MAVWDQTHIRIGLDDGGLEANAWLWIANTGGSLALTADKILRVRFGIEETDVNGATQFTGTFFYSINGGTWSKLGDSTQIVAVSLFSAGSSYVGDGDATAQFLTSGTFRAGVFEDTSSVSAACVAQNGDEFTELEYCVILNTAYLEVGDTIAFRLQVASTPLDAYSDGTPVITLTGVPSPSASPSKSRSPSVSPSASPSASKSPSLSPSKSPSASLSPSRSPSLSPSASLSPSLSPSQSPSVAPTLVIALVVGQHVGPYLISAHSIGPFRHSHSARYTEAGYLDLCEGDILGPWTVSEDRLGPFLISATHIGPFAIG